jgi:hypothetical protein
MQLSRLRASRCEDDPEVIEKYGDHSQDFKPKKIATDGQREREFDFGYNPLSKGGMLTDTNRQASADLGSGWLEQVVSCGR